MIIKINPNKEEVEAIRQAIKENDGYCPCQLEKSERTKCICLNFLEGNETWCHCGLYYKSEE